MERRRPDNKSPIMGSREALAHAANNHGSLLTREDGTIQMVEGYANALVDNEHCVLVTTTVDETGYQSNIPMGIMRPSFPNG